MFFCKTSLLLVPLFFNGGAGTKPRDSCIGLVLPGSGESADPTQSPPTSSLGGSHPAALSGFPDEIRVYQAGE